MLKPSLKYHSSTGYVRNTNGNNNNENSKHNNDGGKPKKKSSSKRPPAALDLTLISNYSTNGNEVSMDNGTTGGDHHPPILYRHHHWRYRHFGEARNSKSDRKIADIYRVRSRRRRRRL